MYQAQIENTFAEKFANEAQLVFQQTESELRKAVRVVNVNGFESYEVPIIATSEAVDNPHRGATLVGINAARTPKIATPINTLASWDIWNFDKFKTQYSDQEVAQKQVMASINRKLDLRIIEALRAGHTDSAHTDGVLDREGVIALAGEMNRAKVWNDGRRFLVIRDGAWTDLVSDTTLTNSDFIRSDFLGTGNLPKLLGFNVIKLTDETLLPSENTGKRTCFAFHSDALWLAMNQEPTCELQPRYDTHSWQAVADIAAGAVVSQPETVFATEIND